MSEFRAFPDTVVEVDGEIEISYQAGNNNEPKYYHKRDVILPCAGITLEIEE